MIIVEGPDGSGKTTLIENLQFPTRLHLKSLRGGVGGTTHEGWAAPGETVANAYTRKLLGAAKQERERGREHIAFDRFHLSERVYGPLLRNHQNISESDLYEMRDVLRRHGVPLIVCLPEFRTTHINVCQENRERPAYQTDEFLSQAYTAWECLADWADLVYNYQVDSIPTQFQAAARAAA